MVAGRAVTPNDVAATEKLRAYWISGEGAARIRWGVPGDFARCVAAVGKYMPPEKAKGYCSNLHVRALGVRPGQETGGRG